MCLMSCLYLGTRRAKALYGVRGLRKAGAAKWRQQQLNDMFYDG